MVPGKWDPWAQKHKSKGNYFKAFRADFRIRYKDLSQQHDNIKLLDENIREILQDRGTGKNSLEKEIEWKIEKRDYIN